MHRVSEKYQKSFDLYLFFMSYFRKPFLIASYVSHQRGGGHIVFGADPVGVGVSVSVGVGVTVSCLHNISGTDGWILTKFAWMLYWDMMKS